MIWEVGGEIRQLPASVETFAIITIKKYPQKEVR